MNLTITLYLDSAIARDWIVALEQDILQKGLHLDKNYCSWIS